MVTPNDIPNLVDWVEARFQTGLLAGDPVSTAIGSGGQRALTQDTAAFRPTFQPGVLNGHAIFRFDGVDDFLMSTAFQDINRIQTTFVISQLLASPPALAMIDFAEGRGTASPSLYHMVDENGNTKLLASSTASTVINVNAAPHVHTVQVTSTTGPTTLRLDGEVVQSLNNAPSGGVSVNVYLGRFNRSASAFWNGDIAGVIRYNRALSASEIADIHTYVQDIYGIAVADYNSPPTEELPVGLEGYLAPYVAGSWTPKPVKWWNGSAWTLKPAKFWNGTAWVSTYGMTDFASADFVYADFK